MSAYARALSAITPNIDRIFEGEMRLLGYQVEQNCTSGRSAANDGQSHPRTGLLEEAPYPKDPDFRIEFGPRGDPSIDPCRNSYRRAILKTAVVNYDVLDLYRFSSAF